MKALLFTLLIFVVIAVVAYSTKPSDDKCRDVAASFVRERMKNDMPHTFDVNLGSGQMKERVDKSIAIEDKFLYKRIHYTYNDVTKELGWGAFGRVKVKSVESGKY